jgi:hypothetical protein
MSSSSRRASPRRLAGPLAFAALFTLASAAQATAFTSFAFDSVVSTSGAFGGVNGVYGSGDVRLDAIRLGGLTLGQAQLQTVSRADIVLDDGVDRVNGGHNLAAGHGLNSVADTWAGQGPATVTPDGADLAAALANHNLSSIVVTRENLGLAVLDVSFAVPTNTFFVWERGGNSDLLVQALDAQDQVTGSFTIQRANYTATGIVVTTDNGAFLNNGQALGSIGLQTDTAVSKLRLVSLQSDVVKHNGPDYKILATAGSIPAVPEPTSLLLALCGLLGVVLWRRQDRRAV